MLKRIISTIAASLLVFGIVLAQPVYADEDNSSSDQSSKPQISLQISPVSNRVVLGAGEKLTYTFNIDNTGSSKFSFKVYASPYSVSDSEYNIDFSTETPRTQVARWIKFRAAGTQDEYQSEATFTLEAGARQTVEYEITVPADVPAGGQYATLFAETIPDNTVATTGVRTVSRVGLIIYGSTNGNTNESIEVVSNNLQSFLTSGFVHAETEVKNTGNTDCAATYDLKIESFFGQTLYEKSNIYDLLPDTSRKITMEWSDTPIFGIFHVTSSIEVLGETYSSTKIVMVMPLFVVIIAIILLTILIVWIIILIRKRQAKKSRVIV